MTLKGFMFTISVCVYLILWGPVANVIPAAADPTEIVFLTWKPNQPEVWDALIERFQKENPDIRVKRQLSPHSSTEYHAIITQRLKNKDPSVDVFMMDVVWPPEFANAGWALDLTSRFSRAEQKKFLRGPISAGIYNQKIYGVPCYMAAGLLYYRKDLLQKYHFNPPVTWSEMISQGNAIVQGETDAKIHIYSGQFKQYEGLVCNMLEFIRSNGGRILDQKKRRLLLDQPASLEAIAFVRDRIIGKAAPRGVLTYEEPESLDLFLQGKSVFHRNWPYAWAVAENPEKSNVSGKIGVAPLPAFKGHDHCGTLGGWHFGINAFSRKPDAAWRFIRFMTSAKAQKSLALQGGLAPTRKAVYEDPIIREKMPHLIAFLPSFEKAVSRPLSPCIP
jgi:multiple sugar transport system substrate-binding protein